MNRRKPLIITAIILLTITSIGILRYQNSKDVQDAFTTELDINSVEVPKLHLENEGYLTAPKKDFRPDETPSFTLDFSRFKIFDLQSHTEKSTELLKVALNIQEANAQAQYTIRGIGSRVLGPDGKEAKIQGKINFSSEGGNETLSITLEKPERNFDPGSYTLELGLLTEDKLLILEQDFTWGVLAINVNKSIYLSGETAYIQMGVLNDKGWTLCDAQVHLEIRNPKSEIRNFSTEDGTIERSGKCARNNVTDVPDYFAYYEIPDKAGVYNMTLTATTENGIRSISDQFEVRESVPFEIERIGPTRIYPPSPYEMKFMIRANEDFEGEVVERVPDSFEIKNKNEKIKITYKNSKVLTWEVNWKKGKTYEISYEFDAPDISPEFYLLGPLEINGTSTEAESSDSVPRTVPIQFREARQWQIASDDVTGNLFPSADGTDNDWDNGTVTCPGCVSAVDSETGSSCSGGGDGDGSDGDSSYIAETGANDSQSFDIDESSIPDNASITAINVFACARRFAGGASMRFYVKINGSDTPGATQTMGATYGEFNEDITVSHTKTSSSDIEIGVTRLSGQVRVTEMWTVITYTPSVIPVTGTVYLSDEVTLGTSGNGGPCDGSTQNVSLRVDGGSATTTECSSTDASYSFGNLAEPAAGATVTVYLTSSQKANTIYVSGADGSGDETVDLFIDAVVVRDDQDGTITIADLVDYDNEENATDMLFNASVTSTPDFVHTEAGVELHVWTLDTFDPNGGVTTTASGSGGDFHISTSSVAYIDTGVSFIGDDILVDTGGRINIDADTIVAGGSATTTGTGAILYTTGTATVTMRTEGEIGGGTGPINIYDLDIGDATTASTTLASSASTTLDVTVGTGSTFNINNNLIVGGGDLTNTTTGLIDTYSGTPTVTMRTTGNLGGGTGFVTIYNLTVGDATTAVTKPPLPQTPRQQITSQSAPALRLISIMTWLWQAELLQTQQQAS